MAATNVNDGAREVDPNRLIEKEGCLGYEKSSGFEAVTNFVVSVGGYVVDDCEDVPMGYILIAEMEAFGDEQRVQNNMKTFFVNNKTLGNQQNIINALNCNSLWIAQTKEPFLPQYIYKLCRQYMKQPMEDKKKFKPVKVIGKQPGAEVWVFNNDVHMDHNGEIIDITDRQFILESKKHDFLANITQELDGGEALAELFRAEKNLFANNFPQVLMAHAVSALAANFDLVVDKFDGCGIPVFIGHPVSGKSTALKAVLSVFGDAALINSVTRKYIESRQAKTTLPFGWDDVSDPKTLGEVAVASFNQAGSASMRGESKPHTVPLVTTNLDSSYLKIKSRWFRIQFEELSPKYKGQERCVREDELKKAMKNAKKSIHLVTSHIHNCLTEISSDVQFEEVEAITEEACNSPELNNQVDHRAQRQYSIMLFCCKKILSAVHMEEEFEGVVEKLKKVILPCYVKGSKVKAGPSHVHGNDEDQITTLLKDEMPKVVLEGEKEDILQFFDQDFLPQSCKCGETITFHVQSLITHLRESGCDAASGVTDKALRFFIKDHDIGCVGKQVLFRNRKTQVSAAHIQRKWFHPEDLNALDEWLGKRNKKERGASKGAKKANQGKSNANAARQDAPGSDDAPGKSNANQANQDAQGLDDEPGTSNADQANQDAPGSDDEPGTSNADQANQDAPGSDDEPGTSNANQANQGAPVSDHQPGKSNANQGAQGSVDEPGKSNANQANQGAQGADDEPGKSNANHCTQGSGAESADGVNDQAVPLTGYVIEQDDIDKLNLDQEVLGAAEEMERQTLKPGSRRKRRGEHASTKLVDSLTPKDDLPDKRTRRRPKQY